MWRHKGLVNMQLEIGKGVGVGRDHVFRDIIQLFIIV
jgi:hypothetical protein